MKKIHEKSSILFYNIECEKYYSSYDLIIDIKYFIKNIKKRNFYLVIDILLLLLLLILFSFLPFIYVCIYLIFLIYLILKIFFSFFFFNTVIIFNQKNENFFQSNSWINIFYNYLKIPINWANFTIYFLIALKKKKIELNTLEPVFFSFILGYPLWFVRLGFKWVFRLYKILNNNIFSRKRFFIWPLIFFIEIKEYLHQDLIRRNLFFFWLMDNNKIIIKDWKIFINPNEFRNIYKQMISVGVFDRFNSIETFIAQNQPHISLPFKNIDGSLSFTTTNKMILEDADKEEEVEIPTFFVEKREGSNQRFIPTYYIGNKNNFVNNGVKASLYKSFGFSNFEELGGFIFKVQVLYFFEKTDQVFFQGEKTVLIGLKEKYSLFSIESVLSEKKNLIPEFIESLKEGDLETLNSFERELEIKDIEIKNILQIDSDDYIKNLNLIKTYNNSSLFNKLKSGLNEIDKLHEIVHASYNKVNKEENFFISFIKSLK